MISSIMHTVSGFASYAT